MENRSFGEASPPMSSIALGCWALTGDQTWGPQDEEQSLATIASARDCGIILYDTAPGYGNGASEELPGRSAGPPSLRRNMRNRYARFPGQTTFFQLSPHFGA